MIILITEAPCKGSCGKNRAAYAAGRLPRKPMLGFWCDGLGFLGQGERKAGCLFHPARNQGRDLRELTGYGAKCRREWCLEARAFARLSAAEQDCLLDLCQDMDSFFFSACTKIRSCGCSVSGPGWLRRRPSRRAAWRN